VNAHKNNELVIFVGAGASVGRPSNLPSFLGLTEIIRDESQLTDVIGRVHDEPLDEILGEMESKHDVDVHLRAAAHTAKKSSLPNALHDAICQLSRRGDVRIVTTNYDTHLSARLSTDVELFLPPALPLGNDFTGLVYLHGSATQHPKNLIVTAADFGRAYLTEAWATRFLERMFATYTTVFVGYSHNDVIMKYLARGLGPHTKPRFAFTHQPDSGMWSQLGITAVGYPPANSHRALTTAIRGWAQRASSGLLDHQRQIKSVMEGKKPADLTPDEASYLESVLADGDIVQFFCGQAQNAEWLDWIIDKPEFRILFDDRATAASSATWRIAGWFAKTFIAPQTSAKALAVCRTFDSRFSQILWEAIARRLTSLRRAEGQGVDSGPWLVALTRTAPTHSMIFLGMLLSQCRLPEELDAALLLFAYLSDPQFVVSRAPFGGLRGDVRLRGDRHQLHDAWNKILKPSLNTAASELLPIVDQHLRKAQRNANLNDESEEQHVLGSSIHPISTISGDGYAEDFDFLVEVARDCIETLFDSRPDQADAQLATWASSDVVLLRRLAIHGWTVRRDKNAEAKAVWLVQQQHILDYDYISEVTPLLLAVISSNNQDALRILANDMLHHAPDDQYTLRRALRTLRWMREQKQSDLIDDALTALTSRHPDLQQLYEALETAPGPSSPPLTPADELALLLQSNDLTGAETFLNEYSKQDPPPDAYSWDAVQRTLVSAVTSNPPLGFDLLDAFEEESLLRPVAETSIVRGWSMAAVDAETAGLILRTTSALDITSTTDEVARMLAGTSDDLSTVKWARFGSSRGLARRCWDAIDATEFESEEDWVHRALNSPAGNLMVYWMRVAENDGQITEELSTEITGILTCGDSRADLAEVIVGHEVSFLYSLDPDWTKDHILPLFDWDGGDQALRTWSGFLQGGRMNRPLLEAGLLDGAIETVANVSRIPERLRHSLFNMLAQIALHTEGNDHSWILRLIRNSDVESRVSWATEIANAMSTMGQADVEVQWNLWMKQLWSNRLQSVPRRMNSQEASAMAAWVIYLDQSLTTGVDLALQHPAGLIQHSRILHDLNKDRIARGPEAIALLLAHLLSNTDLPYYGIGLSDITRRLQRLKAPEASLAQIAEQAFRLGLSPDDD
jgi:hypothetical protein